ncbi:MAG: CehA/McbA family metallohydrolase, partial [bacterium]
MKTLLSAGMIVSLLVLAVSGPAAAQSTAAVCPVAASGTAIPPPHPQPANTHDLCIEIRDLSSGDSLAARVGVFGSDNVPIRPADQELHIFQFVYARSYFYCDGVARLSVPAGEVKIRVGKGFEYFPADTVLDVVSDTTVVFDLERLTRMTTMGWYSGDTHVHLTHSPIVYALDASDLLFLARAEDLNFVNSMEGESFFTGELDPVSEPDRLIFFSKEHGNPYFAHLTMVGLEQWLPKTACEADLGTSFCGATLDRAVYDLVREGGDRTAVIATHPFPISNLWDMSPWPGSGIWRGMPLDLVSGAVDAMDILCYTHIRPPAGVQYYFHALNAGFRLPSSAGTDAVMGHGTSFPLGGDRVYVAPSDGGGMTLEGWIAGLKAGRSFVTNYPLITEFELDGYAAGSVIEHNGTLLRGHVSAICVEPLDTLTIIGNGDVLHAFAPEPGSNGREISADFTINPRDVTWIVARVTGRTGSPGGRWHNIDANGLFAQTAPIYLERTITNVKNRDALLPSAPAKPQRDAANFFLDFLDQIEAIFEANGDFPGNSRELFTQVVYSARHYFTIAAADPPGPFDLVYPCKTWNKPHAVVQTSRPTFTWRRAIDPDPAEQPRYVFMIDTLSSFQTATMVSALGDTTYRPSKKDSLLEGVTYYWSVRAYDPTGFEVSPTTDCCTLMVSFDPTGVPRGAPPVRWSLAGIRPNPFNENVQLTYTIPPEGGRHVLAVYDVRGKLVTRLYDGHRGPGIRRVSWDG